MLSIVVVPGARRALGADQSVKSPAGALLIELERRFTPLANLSLVALIATGMIQMSGDPNYGGFLKFDNTWARAMLFKHLAVIAMALIAGYVALALEPERHRLETLAAAKRPDEQAHAALIRRRVRLARLNLGCGVLTLLFTAIATAQ
jgi:putative copper export protein